MKSGWIKALQEHLRGLLSFERVGFVVSSRAAMADVRSAMLLVVVVAEDVDADVPEGGFRDGDGDADECCCLVVGCLAAFDRTLGM